MSYTDPISGALAGPMLAYLYDGSALPFASLIVAGAIVIGLVHFTARRRTSDAIPS